MSASPVLLRRRDEVPEPELATLLRLSEPHDDRHMQGHLAEALRLSAVAPVPGRGRTTHLWETLATLGAFGLQRARAIEPHLDAVAIAHEAGVPVVPGAVYGVFAAEGGPQPLRARPVGDSWLLEGVKPWCSLVDVVDRALVTAWVDESSRGLFDVDLADPGVARVDEPWVSRGLVDISSTATSMTSVRARPVAGPGWYLDRDGFAYGGMGVAAVWYGAAVALTRHLVRASSPESDALRCLHIGRADWALTSARAVLVDAAATVDAGHATGEDGALLATRVRGVVAQACETILSEALHAMGPRPLVAEEEFAALVADLQIYLRQHHAERDAAASGRLLLQRRDTEVR